MLFIKFTEFTSVHKILNSSDVGGIMYLNFISSPPGKLFSNFECADPEYKVNVLSLLFNYFIFTPPVGPAHCLYVLKDPKSIGIKFVALSLLNNSLCSSKI